MGLQPETMDLLADDRPLGNALPAAEPLRATLGI
jgi:hypothetical protein